MVVDKNPFSFLYETPQYPFARTWRTSVTQKMGDTFMVFTGKISYQASVSKTSNSDDRGRPPLLRSHGCLGCCSPQKDLDIQAQGIESIRWFWDMNDWDMLLSHGRLGLFDYLTCGIPYLISDCLVKLLVWTQTLKEYQQAHESKLVVMIQGLEYFLRFCFILWNGLIHGVARVLVGGMGLFFCGFLIGLPVAYFAEYYATIIKENAFQLQGIRGIDNRVNLDDETFSLKEFLLKEKIHDMQRIFIDSEQYQCSVYEQNDRYYLKINYPKSRQSFYAEIHQDNIVYLEHLFSLNFAHVVNTLIENKTNLVTPMATLAFHSRLFRSLTLAENGEAVMAKKSSVSCW